VTSLERGRSRTSTETRFHSTYPNGAQVIDGQFLINLDGSYTSVAHYTSGSTHTEDGGYTVLDNLVVFSDASNVVTYQASWNSTTMKQDFGGYSLL
jgi:hypothetical protein